MRRKCQCGADLQTCAAYARKRCDPCQAVRVADRQATRPTAARDADVVTQYLNGATLEQIGTQYGITRERVRQVIQKAGIAPVAGGGRLRTRVIRAQAAGKKDARYRALYGCCVAEYRLIPEPAKRRYNHQCANARQRGIGWEFTLKTWWDFWQASGKWDARGRTRDGYVMARHGDVGPYSSTNVKIITLAENAREAMQRTRAEGKLTNTGNSVAGRGRGWTFYKGKYQVVLRQKYLGRFQTADEARAVYLAAAAPLPAGAAA